MLPILGITFPIYAAIAIGFAVVRLGWFGGTDMRTLGRFVLDIAMPALLFRAVATRELGEILHPVYMLVYMSGGVSTIALALGWFTLTGVDPARRAVAVMGTACPNSGFIGYPIMLLAFPDLAGLVLALNMLVENVVLIPICLILIDMARGETGGPLWRRIAGILLGVLRRPMVIGLLLGFAAAVLRLPLPGPLDRLLSMLAASAAALSLVVIGGSLVGLRLTGNRVRALQVAVGKLLVHPALVAAAAAIVPALGLAALPADLQAAVILSAAMPMFGIYPVLAQQLGLEGVASVALMAATSLAFVSLSVLLAWLT